MQVPPAAVFLDPIDVWVPPNERRGICELDGAVGLLAFGGEHGGGCILPGTRSLPLRPLFVQWGKKSTLCT